MRFSKSGSDAATASNIAVPPDGRASSSLARRSDRTVVHSPRSRVAWLKPSSMASSSGASSSSRNVARADLASAIRWPRMLSLMSSARARLTGTRALENCVIGCGTPSSSTMKSDCLRVVTSRPSSSRTVTAVVTSSAVALNPCSRRSIGCCVRNGTTSSSNGREPRVDLPGCTRSVCVTAGSCTTRCASARTVRRPRAPVWQTPRRRAC